MYTKYLIAVLIFICFPVFGQLKIEFSLTDSIAHVTIHNTSKNNYVFPLDQHHLRPYEDDCDSFSDFEPEFPSLALMINIADTGGKREDYIVGYNKTDYFKEAQDKRDLLKQKIVDWGNTNNINDYQSAAINYKIMNNLIYLKAGEKISLKIKVDLYNITAQEFIFYNYIPDKSKKYKACLSLCNYENIDQYLTSTQKEGLKNYKILTGTFESNSIELVQ
ncbi:MAG: hypothetical protein LBE92_09565 [Chryseobacterium sp.]|jgi:hypothetical protein|uniref:hypothetical protein n=1 Tax=Chryseobacterium sp. TaxID=1871047 RepID=UPI002839D42B|nr:hypothetical protein [Chryseobacterium sp.]MDR2236360.1 hypothetical protein [Chryseobacterium sp.]